MTDDIINSAHDRMKKAFEVTMQDLSSIRSGRATPALVENISIRAYGGSQTLRVMEMATITTMDAKTLVIAPFDPSTIEEIEKGIHEANTGLTPVIDREMIRISIPPLSEERRREYIKLSRTKLEGGRIMIRQIRHEAMKHLRIAAAEKTISEDEEKRSEKRIQAMTDETIAELDASGQKKEAELLQV
jgi:ribosome recycling factor